MSQTTYDQGGPGQTVRVDVPAPAWAEPWQQHLAHPHKLPVGHCYSHFTGEETELRKSAVTEQNHAAVTRPGRLHSCVVPGALGGQRMGCHPGSACTHPARGLRVRPLSLGRGPKPPAGAILRRENSD